MEEEKEKRSLAYEVEYLLEGKTSDQENLEAVLNKMLLIRMGLNFVYLQTDTAKQAEAGAMALALATAVALPMLEPVVKQVLLAAWAFGGKCHGFTFSDVRKTRCSGKNSRELAAVALFPDEAGNQ